MKPLFIFKNILSITLINFLIAYITIIPVYDSLAVRFFAPGAAYAADKEYEDTVKELEQMMNESRKKIRQKKKSGPLDSEPPMITHFPPVEIYSGEDIHIEAAIEDGSRITGADILYRKKGQRSYKRIPMSRSAGNHYTAVIPSSKVSAEGIEYYIQATDMYRNRGYDGSRDIPYFIEVKIREAKSLPPKKPWYKKWWVWALVIGAAGGGAAAAMSGGGNNGGSAAKPASGDIDIGW